MTQPPPPPYGAPDPEQPYGGAQQPPPPAYFPPQPQAGVQGSFFINMMGQEYGPMDYVQLVQMAGSGQLRSDAPVRSADSQQYFPARSVPGLFSQREWVTTVVLSWLLGSLGVDRFYLGYIGLGVLKLITFGGCGIWHLVDAILITMRRMPDAEGRPLS